jgi:hypothetical protein
MERMRLQWWRREGNSLRAPNSFKLAPGGIMSTDLVARQGTVAGSSQQLVEDLKAVAGDAGGLPEEVAQLRHVEELSAARVEGRSEAG